MSGQAHQSVNSGHLPVSANGRKQIAVYDPYTVVQPESDGLDLHGLWRIIKRYRWLIFSVFAVSTASALILTMTMRPVYRATALVELKPNPAVITFDSVGRNLRDAIAFRNTQISILKSEAITTRVIDAMDLAEEPEFTGEVGQRDLGMVIRTVKGGITAAVRSLIASVLPTDAANDSETTSGSRSGVSFMTPEELKEREIIRLYQSKLNITQVQDSDLVHVSFESFDPRRAAELANAHSREYIRFIDERRFNSTSSAKEYLEEKIKEAEAELQASEKALTAFARHNNIVDVEDRGNVMQQAFENLSRALTETRQNRIMAEFEYRQARQSNIETLPSVLANSMIQELRRRYADIRAEYREMSPLYKDAYPRMKQLKARKEDLESTLKEEGEKLVAGLKKQYEQLMNQEQTLGDEITKKRTELLDLKERAVSYTILKREWEANRELYVGLLEKQKDFSVASGMEFNDAAIVDKAVTPTEKHSPDNLKNVSYAAVFGIVGGVGIAVLLTFLDSTFNTRDELEEALGIPLMGFVPKIRDADKQLVPLALMSAYQPDDVIAEAVRSIRTGVVFSRTENIPKKILVTSAKRDEGKSTIASNLALILALSGSNVLLVDADLRNPVLSKWLNIESGSGLAEYLNGMNGEVVASTPFANLSAVPAGRNRAGTADLLASVRMHDYLETVSERFDFVIVDGPPCLGVADSMLLGPKMDGVLLVVKAADTERNVVCETVNRLRMVNAPLIGSVLNFVDLNQPEYVHYREQYGYGNESGHQVRTDGNMGPDEEDTTPPMVQTEREEEPDNDSVIVSDSEEITNMTNKQNEMDRESLDVETDVRLDSEAGQTTGKDRNGDRPKGMLMNTGTLRLEIPRDRHGRFGPRQIEEYKRRFPGFDEKIIDLYTRGISTQDIQDYVRELYSPEFSPDLVSAVTDTLHEEIGAWQSRPLEPTYAVVFFDALRIKIRDEGPVRNKAMYLAVGIRCSGHKEILGLWIDQSEGADFWPRVVTELKERGIQDILIAVADGLKGLPEAIERVFPYTQLQTRVVHLIRCSIQFASWKERSAMAKALRPIHQAETAALASDHLEAFDAGELGIKYPAIAQAWRRNWEEVIPFFAYGRAIRNIICATRTMESLHSEVRKAVRSHGHFPSDKAACDLISLVLKNAEAKWTRPPIVWQQAKAQFAIHFEQRFVLTDS